MKRSSTTAFCFSMFLLLLWSCSKESKPAAAVPNSPATPYDYSADSKDKIQLASKVNFIVTGKLSANGFSWGTFPGWLSSGGGTGTSSNNGVSLGRVIFYDNGINLNLGNTSCNGCHGKTGIGNTIEDPATHQDKVLSAHSVLGHSGDIIAGIKAKPYYSQLFTAAYGSPDVTAERISAALALYISSMASVSSQQSLATDPRYADPFK